jgi:hypothetical protein
MKARLPHRDRRGPGRGGGGGGRVRAGRPAPRTHHVRADLPDEGRADGVRGLGAAEGLAGAGGARAWAAEKLDAFLALRRDLRRLEGRATSCGGAVPPAASGPACVTCPPHGRRGRPAWRALRGLPRSTTSCPPNTTTSRTSSTSPGWAGSARRGRPGGPRAGRRTRSTRRRRARGGAVRPELQQVVGRAAKPHARCPPRHTRGSPPPAPPPRHGDRVPAHRTRGRPAAPHARRAGKARAHNFTLTRSGRGSAR